MLLGHDKRRCVTVVLSAFIAFFFCASYWLWKGGEHVRLVPSFQEGDIVGDVGGVAGAAGGEKEVETSSLPLPPAPVETGRAGSKELTEEEIVLAQYDEAPIKELCANTSWADSRDVVVSCESRVGGVGMSPIPPQIPIPTPSKSNQLTKAQATSAKNSSSASAKPSK
jgi:hypothetical protein